MKNVRIVSIVLLLAMMPGCVPPMGSLRLTPEVRELTDAEARTGRIGVAVAYDGEGFDPLKLTVYAALGDDPWSLAQTDRRQYDRFEVVWPGGLSPQTDADGKVIRTVVQIQAVYTEGRQSVSARTSVTITP